jgi:hypothetical protein
MKWRVTTRRAARADIRAARDWYEAQRPGLGDEFLISLSDAFIRLEESPNQFPVYYQ